MDRSDPGGIIAAVLQSAKTGQEVGHGVPVADVTDDPAHARAPLRGLDESAVHLDRDTSLQEVDGNHE